ARFAEQVAGLRAGVGVAAEGGGQIRVDVAHVGVGRAEGALGGVEGAPVAAARGFAPLLKANGDQAGDLVGVGLGQHPAAQLQRAAELVGAVAQAEGSLAPALV